LTIFLTQNPEKQCLRPAQARPKISDEFVNLFLLNYVQYVNIEIVFLDFLKNDFLDLRGL